MKERAARHSQRLILAVGAVALALLLGAVGARGQAPAGSLAAANAPRVVFDGQPLFAMRTAFKSLSPEVRARLISDHLIRLARDQEFDPESLQVIETDISSDLQSRDVMVLAVMDADTLGTGLDRHGLAVERAQTIREALTRYRARRSARGLTWAIATAGVATLVLILVLILIARLRRRINALSGRWIEARRESIKTRTHSILEPDRLLGALAALLNVTAGLLSLLVVYFYASFVLGILPWTHKLGSHLGALVLAPIRELGEAFVDHLPGFVFIGVVATLTYYVLKLVGFIFAEIECERIRMQGFYPEWAIPTERIARVLVVALAIVIVYPSIPGSDSLAFKGVSIFLGVLVSLGSTSTVGNLVAGIMVVYMRSYRVGDVVKVGEVVGRVVETDVLATRVRTAWNVEITIPNSTMISSNVINYSRQAAAAGLILHTEVTIGYNAAWRQVHAMLLRAAGRTSGLLKDPAPFVLQRELGNFAVTYQINGYTRHPETMLRTYHELHKNILDEFNEFGVEILTPSYEGDRDQPAVVPKSQWYAPPAIPPGQPGADE